MDMREKTRDINEYGCVLLAGGEGKRMGYRNKAELKFGYGTFKEKIAAELRCTGYPCYISVMSLEQETPEGFFKIQDSVRDSSGRGVGPSGGIYSCLKRAVTDGLRGLFFVPCDAPNFKAEIIFALQRHIRNEDDALFWQTPDGRDQTAFGFYSVSCIPYFEEDIQNGLYKIRRTIDKVSYRVLSSETENLSEWLFTNINNPEDYRNLITSESF